MKTQQKLKKYLEEIKKNNKSGKNINAILEINPDVLAESKKSGKLAGRVIAVKANINVKGLHTSCGSKVLENYKAGYDATVIKKIKDEGGIILGMANCDEFACGSSGETSAFGATKNPVNTKLITGGSSSGSAAGVAAGFCDMALGSDTGGSIRAPANFCGVVGVKPTYSSVSRYGLIDLSMSLDQIGVIAKNVSDVALLLSVIQGKDEQDSISQKSKKLNLSEIEKTPKNVTVGVLDFPIKNKEIQKLVDDKIKETVKKYGWKVKKIKLDYLDLAIATYYPLVYVEFFSATRRFDGRRYGKKIEYACGPEVMRRILGGSEISKAEHHGRYYHLALKAKKLIEDELAKAFKGTQPSRSGRGCTPQGGIDCIVSPVCPKLPHKIGEKISVEDMYSYDALTIPHNLYGNCALSLPVGKIDGIPVGMQIACDRFQDEKMLRIARAVEKLRD